jgi:hypothetical protein
LTGASLYAGAFNSTGSVTRGDDDGQEIQYIRISGGLSRIPVASSSAWATVSNYTDFDP